MRIRELTEELRDALDERQKGPATGDFPDESKVRKGSFKIGHDLSVLARKEFKGELENVLFRQQRDVINRIPRNDLPKIWGQKNIPDAQDVLARNPRKAFQQWLRNVHKVSPKVGKWIRRTPENVPLWFYLFMVRLSGREMADIIQKKYFSTSQEYKPRKKQ
jgi:hypothetical protein